VSANLKKSWPMKVQLINDFLEQRHVHAAYWPLHHRAPAMPAGEVAFICELNGDVGRKLPEGE
jgi:hypothetical protein